MSKNETPSAIENNHSESKMAPIYILVGMFLEIAFLFWAGFDSTEAAFVNGKSQDIGVNWTIEADGTTFDFPKTFRTNGGAITIVHEAEAGSSDSVLEVAVNNAYVTLNIDGKAIYDDSPESGRDSIETVRDITLPEDVDGKSLKLTLTPVKGAVTMYARSAMIMRRDISIVKRLKDGIVPLICCVIMLLASMAILTITAIKKLAGWGGPKPLWLFTCGIISVLQSFALSGIPTLFWGNEDFFLFSGSACLAILPIFFICYLEPETERGEKFWNALYIISIIAGAVEPLLRGAGFIPSSMGGIFADILIIVASVFAGYLYIDPACRDYGKAWLFEAVAILLFALSGLNNSIMGIFASGIGHAWTEPVVVMFSLILMAVYQALSLVYEYRAEVEQTEKAAIQANEAKGKFLANMSHEIRTPINAVLGMDEMILRETAEDETKTHAEDIYAAGKALLSVVNDILDLSKIEAGKMEILPDEYDTCALMHDIVSMVEPKASSKGLDLKVEIDPGLPLKLYGDETRIRQTIINILNNAVKYTEKGSVTLRVKWKYTQKKNGLMDVRVKDTGVGIKEEDMPKLFAEYERIEESRHKNTEGTGLGLSITIRMLKMMDSALQVKSKYGKGSIFYFILPQGVIDGTKMGDFKEREKELKGRYSYETSFIAPDANILVVDDNDLNLKVFTGLLKENEINITTALSGKECLNLVAKNHYDLIFLDHMMPVMDGIETFKRMRTMKNNQSKGVPVYALTANAIAGAKEEYLAVGFDGFVSKPIISDQLQELIRTNLPQEYVKAAPKKDKKKGKAPMDTSAIPDIDGLDKDYAMLHFPDIDLLRESLRDFYDSMDVLLEKLESNYEKFPDEEEVSLYRTNVHGMKGAALAVGAFQVGGLARTLEIFAKNNDIISIYALHPIFVSEWGKLKISLRKALGIKKKKLKKASPDVIAGLLMMISSAMDVADIDQADAILKQLKGYEMNKNEVVYLKSLSEAVMDIDPEKTSDICDKWNITLKGE